MKNYIKPTVHLALDGTTSGTVSSCEVAADMQLIQSIVGGADADKIFNITEACEIGVALDMYCKFTSSELGAAQAFIS